MAGFIDTTASIEGLEEVIKSDKFTCIIVWANWKRGSEKLLSEISGCSELMAIDQLRFLSLCIDEDADDDATDSAEDIILHLNNKYSTQPRDIPSLNVYKGGLFVMSMDNLDPKAFNVNSLLEQLRKLINGDCKIGSGCCAGSSSVDQLQYVTKSYASTVAGQSSCCVSVDSGLMGYSTADLLLAGGANLGVGCGNPLSIANLQKGDRVLDLGSGAGIDCFLSAAAVGPTGSVVGVDMTPEMVFTARKAAAERKTGNVTFRLGEIEHMPLGDATVDVVLSNCVINLSPDKGQVMLEMARVLAPGGRIAISDVLLREKDNEEQALPEHLRTMESLAC